MASLLSEKALDLFVIQIPNINLLRCLTYGYQATSFQPVKYHIKKYRKNPMDLAYFKIGITCPTSKSCYRPNSSISYVED